MKLDHINIRTNDLENVKDTLSYLLQLEVADRPSFDAPGYWLYSEGFPIVHLNQIDFDPGDTTGALDHVAFKDDDFDGLKARLEKKKVEHTVRTVPGSGRRQVLFKITHDVTIEMNFDPAA